MCETSNSKWRICLLGPLRIERGSHSLSRFQTQKTASLLAYLCLNAGRAVPREFLCDLLWPQSDPASGRASLTQAVSWIRRQLDCDGSVVIADRQSVALSFERISIDVQEFLDLLEDPNGESLEARKQRLEAAVALYSGEFLQGQSDNWIKVERLMLGDTYVQTLRRLGTCCEELGDYDAAIKWRRALVKLEPLNEDAHERLILLYARTDQRGAIHRHFADYAAFLRGQGREPSKRLSELVSKLLAEREETPARAVVTWETPEDDRLPVSLTRFFGRDEEIESVVRLVLEGARLVTLYGMSGVGKTRLSVEIARALRRSFDNHLFVPLADVPDEREIGTAILAQLGVKAPPGDSSEDQLVKRLAGGSTTLVVLDNLDHLVESGLPTLQQLLRRAPNTYFLATSLIRLGLHGEQARPIQPLPVPEPDADLSDLLSNPSLRLYLDRAAAVEPNFKATAENVADLVALCRQLEGLPLAIELAAAWASASSPQETLQELTHRFDVLVSRTPDVPDRHKSLRASLTYSFQLLPKDLRALLPRLTVFEGGWTLAAATTVLGKENLLDPLRRLRDRSLVSTSSNQGETRFSMMQVLREFSAEQLATDDLRQLQTRHAHFYRDLVAEAHTENSGAKRAGWLERLERERANVLAALRWCEQSASFDLGLAIAAHFAWYWKTCGPLEEAVQWLTLFLERTGGDSELRAEALHGLGNVEFLGASLDAAERSFEAALKIDRALNSPSGIAANLSGLSTVALVRHEMPKAEALLQECIEICLKESDLPRLAYAHGVLACVLCDMDQFDRAKHHFDECLVLQTSRQDVEGIARVYCNLGRWARVQNRLALARHYSDESLRICQNLGNRRMVAQIQLNLSVIASQGGDYAAALRRLAEGLEFFTKHEDHFGFQCSVAELVQLGVTLDRLEEAAALMGIFDVLSPQGASAMSPHDQSIYEASCQKVRDALTPDEIDRGRTAALAMSFPEMGDFVMSALDSLESVAQRR